MSESVFLSLSNHETVIDLHPEPRREQRIQHLFHAEEPVQDKNRSGSGEHEEGLLM